MRLASRTASKAKAPRGEVEVLKARETLRGCLNTAGVRAVEDVAAMVVSVAYGRDDLAQSRVLRGHEKRSSRFGKCLRRCVALCSEIQVFERMVFVVYLLKNVLL